MLKLYVVLLQSDRVITYFFIINSDMTSSMENVSFSPKISPAKNTRSSSASTIEPGNIYHFIILLAVFI